MRSIFCLFESLSDDFPIHDFPKVVKLVGSAVLVIEVVGMFPNIETEQWSQAFGEGITRVRLFRDDEFAGLVLGKPCPAGPEQGDASVAELLLEILQRSPLTVDRFRQFAIGRFGRWRELGEIKIMVQDLPRVIKDGAIRLLDDLLERHCLERRVLDEFIERVDVISQVLVVMETDGPCADDGLEGICLVGQLY